MMRWASSVESAKVMGTASVADRSRLSASGFEGGQLADVEDPGVGDDDLRLVGVAVTAPSKVA